MVCALLVAALFPAGGCTSLADRIVAPDPGRQAPGTKVREMESAFGIARRNAVLETGIELAWRGIPSANRGFWAEMTPTPGGGLEFAMGTRRGGKNIVPVAPRGTVVYLHGWNSDATAMLPWALALSEHGYRGIAVDLRGHGSSGDAPPGFGPRESKDVAALVALLEQEGGIVQPLYLFGVSYGAATSLFAEPLMRGRIAGIIALEPFVNAAAGIRGAVDGWMQASRGGWRGRLARTVMRWRTSPGDIDREIDEAGSRLGLDLRTIDVTDVVRDSRTCTLLIHGSDDRWLSPRATRELASVSPLARYTEVDGTSHMTLPMRVDLLGGRLATWLDAVADDECPALPSPQVPPPPAPRVPSPASPGPA